MAAFRYNGEGMKAKRTKAKQSVEWARDESIDQAIDESEREVESGAKPIPLETARKQLDESAPNEKNPASPRHGVFSCLLEVTYEGTACPFLGRPLPTLE